jgi:hypothetical protein
MQNLGASLKTLVIAAGLVAVAYPAAAWGWLPIEGGVGTDGGSGSVATPAPLAGAGIVAVGVAAAALYAVVRRYRKHD